MIHSCPYCREEVKLSTGKMYQKARRPKKLIYCPSCWNKMYWDGLELQRLK